MSQVAGPDAPGRSRLGWRGLALIWLGARGIVFGIWAYFGLTTQNDVLYYWHRVHLMWSGTPLSSTLVEYPTPVVWFLSVPYWLAGRSRPGFVVAFILLMLVLDMVFAVALWRTGSTRRTFAVLFWIVFTFVMGPTTYMRFDLVPAVLGGLAVLSLLAARHSVAGALVGLGAAFKLWPALLWPGTLGERRGRLRATLGFVVVGGGLAVLSLVLGGWNRLVSPLAWQSERGLQIESVWATPFMLARAFSPSRYVVAVSQWQAFEVTGSGTRLALSASTLATVVGYVAILATYAWWLRRRDRTVVEAALIMVLVITVIIVTNKTFSPQYMMWLGGPVAAMLASAGRGEVEQRPTPSWRDLRVLAGFVLGITLVTQLVYPIMYQPLVHGGPLLLPATVVLVLRNAAVVGLLLWLAVLVARMLRGRGTGEDGRDPDQRKVGP